MAAPDEEALKQFIARLPDLDNDDESDSLGEEERAYIEGAADAYRVLSGEAPKTVGMINVLADRADRKRRTHKPKWTHYALSGTVCDICERRKREDGDEPWHSTQA
jgi:hypothetical protein